jgi:prolyl-tRNA editing enzyme YbaK/EbsC (Cys-tRNA(Pro) deacylase)
MKLYDNIVTRLQQKNIDFKLIEHEPVFTSEIASQVVNHPESEGTKSLALKTNKGIVIATVAGNERLDFKTIKQLLQVKKISMCDSESLQQELGTEIGGLAPFGYDSEVKLLVSSTLFNQENIYINPGRNDVTLKLIGQDFASVMLGNNAIIF